MTTQSKREYLQTIRRRYAHAGKRYKTKLLDELCRTLGVHRKYAIRRLRQKSIAPRRKPGPKRRYGPAEARVLQRIWLAAEQLCSKRLQVALPLWLPFYEQTYEPIDPQLRTRLLTISPAAIDRLLRPARVRYRRRLRCTTQPGSLLKQQIPIRIDHTTDCDGPGILEADSVSHCGGFPDDRHAWSLDFTDVFSQWTELRAVANRGAAEVLPQVRDVEAKLPFPLCGFDCDNGGEFLNFHLMRHFVERPQPVKFTRSRPYHHNDNARVEQKNWTHVRQLVGYGRFDNPAVVPTLNDLYASWCQLHNFFCPSMKLAEKQRVGSRWVKKYDAPQTPYQRLLQSPQVSEEAKEKLRAQYARLNPFALKKEVERKLQIVLATARCTRT